MPTLPGNMYIPVRAQPRFGRGAFRGSVSHASTPTSDMAYADPAPYRHPGGFAVTPVNVTSFSAGNHVRLGVVKLMYEWWYARPRSNGQIFVMQPSDHRRTVARRMSRVRRLDHLVGNRRVIYDAPSYGPQGDETGVARTSGLPDFNFNRRRR